MTWTAFVLAALKALPAFVQLVASIKASADARANQDIGYERALRETLSAASEHLALARQAEAEADRDHAADSADTAFDSDFRRSD